MAEENGILDRFDSIDPVNFDMIRTRLEQSPKSPDPDLQEFKDFRKRIQLSQNEQGVAQAVMPLLCRHTGEGYTQVFDQKFTMFPAMSALTTVSLMQSLTSSKLLSRTHLSHIL